MNGTLVLLFVVLMVLVLIAGLQGFEFNFGDCPVVFNEPCSQDRVKFTLYAASKTGHKEFNLQVFKPEFPVDYDYFRPLKIVIHGYGGISVDSATTNVTKAYQDIGYNVILVNWESLGFIPCYATAYLNSWHIGQCVAVLITGLVPKGISLKKLHIVGFSLGAHIAGFAGTHIRRSMQALVGRITGLDPALPFFATLNNEWKLDPDDADYVDVVHTSAGFFGKIEPTGHVDFYMNGGSMQPFCYNRPHPPICSHIMAGLYFAESMTGKKPFVGVRCDSWGHLMFNKCSTRKTAIMGEFMKPNTYGVYIVQTSNKQPYALGFDSVPNNLTFIYIV